MENNSNEKYVHIHLFCVNVTNTDEMDGDDIVLHLNMNQTVEFFFPLNKYSFY